MKQKYGKWWPDSANDASIELDCFKRARTIESGGLGQAGHLMAAIRANFPEYDSNGKPVYAIHEWTQHRAAMFCRHLRGGDRYGRYMGLWGPAASAKTTDIAMFCLNYYAASPTDTVVVLCSTTLPMLERRIWGEITRFHSMCEGVFPGEILASKHAILLDSKKPRSGVFGVAVRKGSIKEALGNIHGQHNRRVILVIDEAQATHAAALEAADNLSAGCEEFLLIIMGNPESMFDPLGIYSEPVNGYESIHPDTHSEWETKLGGNIYFYDGFKSPGVKHPKRFPFLLNQEQIDNLVKKRGINSPQVWSQRRGFMPLLSSTEAPLSEAFMLRNQMLKMGDDILWREYELFAGCDPSFTPEGDPAMAVLGRIGITTENERLIVFDAPVQMILDVTIKDEPMTYQIARRFAEFCKHHGVHPNHAAIEVSATQGGVADICDMEADEKFIRVQFGGQPSDRRLSADDEMTAKQVYEDRLSELWFAFVAFGRHQEIRGIAPVAAKQFAQRLAFFRGGRYKVESKRDLKKRGIQSPNEADAYVTCLEAMRRIKGLVAGDSRSADVLDSSTGPSVLLQSVPMDDRYDSHMLDNPSDSDSAYSTPAL